MAQDERVPDPSDDIGIQLGLAYAAFVEWLNAEMAVAGFDDVGSGFGYVFRLLAPGPTTLTALAADLRMTTQGAAKIIAAMEEAGYVSRRVDPADARARLIELDDRGRAAARTARRLHARFERHVTAEVGDRRWSTFRSVLATVADVSETDPADRRLRPL
jgi:DNA-binding MarR family transcriptional regulator